MANKKVSALTSIPAVDRAADILYIVDTSAGTSNKVTPNNLLGIVGAPVGDTDTATLTNKTLTSPTISSPTLSGTISGTYTIGGTPTFPSSVVTLTGSQTLTNKVLTSPTINTATIANPTLTVDTISEYTSTNGVTIDGLNIKDSALNTNNSVVTANITDSAVTPAKLLSGTGSAWTHTSYTPTFTNLTVGNGTHNSKYIQIGKTVICRIQFILGSTSSVSGSVTFTLPVTAAAYSTGTTYGFAMLADTGTAEYTGTTEVASATSAILYANNAAGTYVSMGPLSSTAPFTWGNGDILSAILIYEAA